MPRYHLHLYECGSISEDEEGVELPDLASARSMAIASARDIMCGDIRDGRLSLSCWIEVVDGGQRVIERVAFRDVIIISDD